MEEQNQNRTKWLHLRLKPEEYQKIYKGFTKSTARKISEFARKILLKKPLVVTYRNKSLDDFMIEMIELRKELNAIGNNFNQSVKKLHTLDQISEFRQWIITSELEKKVLFNKIDEIKKHLKSFSERWLQS